MKLEIFCDASVKTFEENGRMFVCAGAYCPVYNSNMLMVLADSTNNKGEITAILLAVKLAKQIIDIYPDIDYDVIIYSDSMISVQGLRVWMHNWLATSINGILYNSEQEIVANQDVFLNIIRLLVENDIRIRLYHIKSHIRENGAKSLLDAQTSFYISNGVYLSIDEMKRIAHENNFIDYLTRNNLKYVNPNDYPIVNNRNEKIVVYVPPQNWHSYIV